MNSLLSKQDAQQSIELDSVLSNIFISNLYTYISLEDKKKKHVFLVQFSTCSGVSLPGHSCSNFSIRRKLA